MVCPVCQNVAAEPFLTLRQVPVFCNVLHETEAAARAAARSDIALALCPRCASIYNSRFDASLVAYAAGYSNPLHFSVRFREFAEELGHRLVETYRLADGSAVEIGCGDGFFLDLLVRNGMRRAVGYDPSMAGRHDSKATGPAVHIVPALFGAQPMDDDTDAVVCRHVFEHVPDPDGFLRNLRQIIGTRDPLVYFEVPNAEWMLEADSIWDVIYEHFSYWTPAALEALFDRSGFRCLSLDAGFGDQFLMVEARPSVLAPTWPSAHEIGRLRDLCRRFGASARQLSAHWRTVLRDLAAQGGTAVLWGSGSKGATFANLVAGEERLLAGLVDINPDKQGRYVGGCGLPVLAPEALREVRPDLVLLINDNYAAEVSARLKAIGMDVPLRSLGAGAAQAAPGSPSPFAPGRDPRWGDGLNSSAGNPS